MTEVEENQFRNLMARMREEDPATFITITLDVLLSKIEDNSLVAIRRKDDDDVPCSVIAIFNGHGPAKWAIQAMNELQLRSREKES